MRRNRIVFFAGLILMCTASLAQDPRISRPIDPNLIDPSQLNFSSPTLLGAPPATQFHIKRKLFWDVCEGCIVYDTYIDGTRQTEIWFPAGMQPAKQTLARKRLKDAQEYCPICDVNGVEIAPVLPTFNFGSAAVGGSYWRNCAIDPLTKTCVKAESCTTPAWLTSKRVEALELLARSANPYLVDETLKKSCPRKYLENLLDSLTVKGKS